MQENHATGNTMVPYDIAARLQWCVIFS